jgi:competence protein ComEC
VIGEGNFPSPILSLFPTSTQGGFMLATIAAILCFAYILGLLLTGIPGTMAGIPIGAIVMLAAGLTVAFSIRRIWRMAPRAGVWLTAGLVGVLAILYFQIRLPQPSATDICHLVAAETARGRTSDQTLVSQLFCQPSSLAQAGKVQVTGTVDSPPRLTRSNRLQFELAATQIRLLAESALPQTTTGKVYVTVPPVAGEQLYPGLPVLVEGSLYSPPPAVNPGGFDFAKYLRQQGIFTGMNAERLEYPTQKKPVPSLFWSIRQRIVQAQAFGLGQPEGALLSAMVIGKATVDLPFEIQDQFKQTGLAHALAASGTQVSLLVGIILALTKRLASRWRLILGLAILVLYIGLTGIEASVLRAGIMGGMVLIALALDRKIKPLGSLLFAATVLLIINPAWIWDLGFQLSFLATLGLLVTVPVLMKWLDWMPTLFASMFAVPIAAYLWTLPLILFVFGVVSPYSILINIIVSPLITLISIGGMISAVAALIYPLFGSGLAWLLYYPTHWLIELAAIGSQLPGSRFAVGTVNLAQILGLYGLIVLVWRWQTLHPYWWLMGLIGFSLVAVPAAYTAANLSQITVLMTAEKPVLLIREQGKVGLIHAGSTKDTEFTLLPLLQQSGINQIDWAIAPNLRTAEIAAWQAMIAAKPIRIFYSNLADAAALTAAPGSSFAANQSAPDAEVNPAQSYQALLAQVKNQQGVALPLSLGQKIQLGNATAERILARPDIFQFQLAGQTWLWFEGVPGIRRQADLTQRLATVDLIVWSGKALSPQLLEKVNPKAAVAYGKTLDPATEHWLMQRHVTIHRLETGAIQVTNGRFTGINAAENRHQRG